MGCFNSKNSVGSEPIKILQKTDPTKLLPTPAIESQTSCGPWLKTPDDIKGYPVFPAQYQQSLLCRHLSLEIWQELKDLSDNKTSFRSCILSGC